jgi:hypothetical protein
MKYLGGLIALAFAAVTFLGVEPFTATERGKVPSDARRGAGGIWLWHSGIRGGK